MHKKQQQKKPFLSIYHRTGLPLMNSLSFYLAENAFILPSLLSIFSLDIEFYTDYFSF